MDPRPRPLHGPIGPSSPGAVPSRKVDGSAKVLSSRGPSPGENDPFSQAWAGTKAWTTSTRVPSASTPVIVASNGPAPLSATRT